MNPSFSNKKQTSNAQSYVKKVMNNFAWKIYSALFHGWIVTSLVFVVLKQFNNQ